MKPNSWAQAEDENLDEVDPFQLDEDSDFPSSSDELNSSGENTEDITVKNTPMTIAELNKFLATLPPALGQIDENVYNNNQEVQMESAIPEQYAPREERPLGESVVLQPNADAREGMLAAMPESPLLNTDDSISPPLPQYNGRLNSGPLVHIPMGSPTEPSWDTSSDTADAEECLDEDEEEFVTRFQCDFNHASCLNYHGHPWLYSDDDDSEHNSISDLSDTDSHDSPTASSMTVMLDKAGYRYGAQMNCPLSGKEKTVSFVSPENRNEFKVIIHVLPLPLVPEYTESMENIIVTEQTNSETAPEMINNVQPQDIPKNENDAGEY